MSQFADFMQVSPQKTLYTLFEGFEACITTCHIDQDNPTIMQAMQNFQATAFPDGKNTGRITNIRFAVEQHNEKFNSFITAVWILREMKILLDPDFEKHNETAERLQEVIDSFVLESIDLLKTIEDQPNELQNMTIPHMQHFWETDRVLAQNIDDLLTQAGLPSTRPATKSISLKSVVGWLRKRLSE